MRAATFLEIVDRFWSKVENTGGCWIWTGETNADGYGRFTVWSDGRRERILAHRLALRLVGHVVPDDLVVMHSCDNPACVNPAHLSMGTQRENLHDALEKGRLNTDGLTIGQQSSTRELKRAKAARLGGAA